MSKYSQSIKYKKYKKAQADAPKCSGTFSLRQESIKYNKTQKEISP
ncbi:hypothetical protein [Pontibacter flavimaris]|nr:hypothetical protein [Pontibacter flavimaris]